MKILLSGSGSGGHIYPCISLYKELKKNHDVFILIFKNIDKKIYDKNCIKYIFYDDSNSSINKCRFIKKIIENNKIDKVITFGGKNSIYVNLVAKLNRIESFIFEQNVVLGKANKFNYLLCKKIFTNFNINLKKEINVGNPNSFCINTDKKLKLFNNTLPTILITMGSLGSSSVNKTIEKFINETENYNVIYITGNNVKTKVKENKQVKIYEFYTPLTDLMNISDLIISRAGASTLSEIIALNKPSIVIPSPYVKNNHQEKNALFLKHKNAIEMILEKDLNIEILKSKVRNLTNNVSYYNQLKNNLKSIHLGNNFQQIIKEVINENHK